MCEPPQIKHLGHYQYSWLVDNSSDALWHKERFLGIRMMNKILSGVYYLKNRRIIMPKIAVINDICNRLGKF